MARKLDEAEQRFFAEALLLTEMAGTKKDATSLLEALLQKRDAPAEKSGDWSGWMEHLWSKDSAS